MADDSEEILRQQYGPQPSPLEQYGTHGATQFGPFGKLALDPRKLADLASGAWGMVSAPFRAAEDIKKNYRPGPENEVVNQDIGRQAFDAGSVIMGGAPMVEKNALGTFGGVTAKTADHAKLAQAKELLERGFSPESAYRDTGWFQGKDGQWRFEIDDSGAKVNHYPNSPAEAYEAVSHRAMVDRHPFDLERRQMMEPYKDLTTDDILAQWKEKAAPIIKAAQAGDKELAMKLSEGRAGLDAIMSEMGNRRYGPMSAYIDHPALYEAYPELKDVHTRIDPNITPRGYYHPETPTMGEQIALKELTPWGDGLGVGLHEKQHWIQNKEGFSPGYNTTEATKDVAQARYNEPELLGQMRRRQDYMGEQARDHLRKAEAGDPHSMELVEASRKNWLEKQADNSPDNPYRMTPEDALLLEMQERDPIYKNIAANYTKAWYTSRADPTDLYRKTAGEVEPRNVQKRQKMDRLQRRQSFPRSTEDVPDAEQILRSPRGQPAFAASDDAAAGVAAKDILEQNYGAPPVERRGYHGSDRGFDKMRESDTAGLYPDLDVPHDGVWFSDDPARAERFAKSAASRNKGDPASTGPAIYPADLKFKNPYIHDAGEFANEGISSLPPLDELRARGHDGVMVPRAEWIDTGNGPGDYRMVVTGYDYAALTPGTARSPTSGQMLYSGGNRKAAAGVAAKDILEEQYGKGAPNSREARLAVAKEKGFDTEAPFYRGMGTQPEGGQFTPTTGGGNALGPAVYMGNRPTASGYATQYLNLDNAAPAVHGPLYARGKLADIVDWMDAQDAARTALPKAQRKNDELVKLNAQALLKAKGYTGVTNGPKGNATVAGVFDPNDLRPLTHEEFDPKP